MPVKDLGTKHVCFKCGTKFYDLRKPEILCPKCGSDQRQSPALKPAAASEKRSRPPPPRPAAPPPPPEEIEPEHEPEDEADDAESDLEEDDEP